MSTGQIQDGEKPGEQKRLFGLDLLRAIAILIVVEQHGRSLLPSSVASAVNLGATDGVDIFFVLSGFLIGSILIRQLEQAKFRLVDFRRFLVRRWLRTLPNYYFALLLNVLMAVSATSVLLSKVQISKFAFFLQNFSYRLTDMHFFSESWSLAIEEHFYLLLPVVCFAIRLVTKNLTPRYLALCAIATLIIAPIIFRHYKFESIGLDSLATWNDEYRTIVILRIDAIAIGVLAAWVMMYLPELWRRASIPASALGVVAAVALDRTHILNNHYGLNWFTAVGYFSAYPISVALCLPLLTRMKRPARSVLASSIEKISLLSYSVYLFHNSLLRIPLQELKPESQLVQALIYCSYWVAAFSIATLTYRFIETPALNLRDRHFR